MTKDATNLREAVKIQLALRSFHGELEIEPSLEMKPPVEMSDWLIEISN